MTVCVAALAEDAKAIVLVSDKALTVGASTLRPALQGEAMGVEKMLPVGSSGWNALIAGDSTAAERVVSRACNNIDADTSVAGSHETMMDCMKRAYQAVWEESLEDSVLRPRLLSKDDIVKRSKELQYLGDELGRDAYEAVRKFSLGTTLLVCGFDSAGKGHIFTVSNPGQSDSHEINGFWAIGIGAETAISRLLWNQADRNDSLHVAVYQALEAKGYAEMVQGVGFFSDLWVMTEKDTIPLSEDIHALLIDVFRSASRLPFKELQGDWPENWERRLRRYTTALMKKASRSDDRSMDSGQSGVVPPTRARKQPATIR